MQNIRKNTKKFNGGRNRKNRVFVGDFETTVYKGQVNTEVWAAATVELFTEDVQIFHSIGDLLKILRNSPVMKAAVRLPGK